MVFDNGTSLLHLSVLLMHLFSNVNKLKEQILELYECV